MAGFSLSEFFAMGGYGFYVWGSFGLSMLVFVWNIIGSQRLRQRVLLDVSQMKQVSPKRFSESISEESS